MRKWLGVVSLMIGSLLFGVPSAVFAHVETAGQVVEVGNKYCPVSGDKVSGKHFVDYQGKRYGLCCEMCKKKFLKNPEKFIAEMKEQETKGQSPSEGGMDSEEHEHHHDSET